MWRYAWPLPWTLAGLLVAGAICLLGGRWRCRHGALEAYGGLATDVYLRLPRAMRFDAITIGHVIIGLDGPTLDAARAHEQVHVRQYERWGVLFVPAYVAASAWQWARGACPYRDNPFEREAYACGAIGATRAADIACAGSAKVE